MQHIDDEIYQANQQTIQQNNEALSASQSAQVSQIIDSKLSHLTQETIKQKANMDYFMGKLDPSKPDFDQTCTLGAKIVEQNDALKAGFAQAENKPQFLYEIGLREKAYQELYQKQQPQTNQEIIPGPQHASSPYQAPMHAGNVHWNNLSENQFLSAVQEMGLSL